MDKATAEKHARGQRDGLCGRLRSRGHVLRGLQYAKKKRFICHEVTGAFFTPEEAALERAKSIAKKQKT